MGIDVTGKAYSRTIHFVPFTQERKEFISDRNDIQM